MRVVNIVARYGLYTLNVATVNMLRLHNPGRVMWELRTLALAPGNKPIRLIVARGVHKDLIVWNMMD